MSKVLLKSWRRAAFSFRRGITSFQTKRVVGKLMFWIAMLIGIVVFVSPFLWMVFGSFKTEAEIWLDLSYLSNWLPKSFYLGNFRDVFLEFDFLRWFFNTFVVSVSVLIIRLFICSITAFGFAKYRFPGKEVLFILVLSSMMIPFEVTMIPLFIMVHKFGWLDTYRGIVFPHVANAFGIFLMRQFIRTMPDELLDAGRIDGCSELGIYWRIVLPLCKPGLTALAIITFLGTWNEFIWPLLVIQTESMKTLTLGIAIMVQNYIGRMNILLTASLVMTIPILIFYLVFQKNFVEGVTLTGLKS